MANLTSKQEAFCLAIVDPSVKDASEAYRIAYDAEKMSAAAIAVAASRLLDNAKVALRIKEIREPAAEAAGLTLEQHLTDLQRLRDKAEASEKFGPAIQAEVARGKASGLYVEKVEQSGPGGKPVENKWTVEIVKPEEK